MERRTFIRILGGGIVAAGASSLTGCSTRYPEDAVAAWNGPGGEPDLRRWALGYAILSPNSHNRQPWLVDLREPDAITLHVDRERMLPMTDPWFRQIMVSQGTFLESLVLALRERGVAPRVELFPLGEFAAREVDSRPVAKVSWGAAAGAGKDPLFGQLLRRHTAKVDYDMSRPVTAATLAALARSVDNDNVRFGGTVDPARLQPLREVCRASARIEMLTERTVMESVRLTRVGPAEIARHRDGISINTLMPRIADMVGAFDRTSPPAEDSAAFGQMAARFDGHSRTAMGFVWLSTDSARNTAAGTSRSAEVRAGRAYQRLQLTATALGLQMHPMSQAPQEFSEMKPLYDELHRLTVGKPAMEETVQLFCRVGYCDPQQHTPRRAIESFIAG